MKNFSATALAYIIVFLAGVNFSFAATVVSVEDGVVFSGPTTMQTSLDVFLDLTGVDDGGSIDVGNFQVRVLLDGLNAGTDVSIVGISDTMSLMHPQAEPLVVTSTPMPDEGLGSTLNFAGALTLNDNAGLMRVILEVQPGVQGDYTVQVVPGIGNTELTDPVDFVSQLPYSTRNGLLSISAVPEPGSFAFLGLASVALMARRSRKRKPSLA